jgi:hypothetical protein
MMRIEIKTNVNVPELPSIVEIDKGTVHDVLIAMVTGTHFAHELLNPVTGVLKFDGIFDVRLNGETYYALPKGLDTEVRDGDAIELSLILLGGG